MTYQISWKYDDDELCFAFSETWQGIMLLADTLEDIDYYISMVLETEPTISEDRLEKGLWFDHIINLIPRKLTQEEAMATIMSVVSKCVGEDDMEMVGKMLVSFARSKDQGPRHVH